MVTANALGLVELERRELPEAERLFSQARGLAVSCGLDLWSAIALDNLAAVHKEAGRYAPALDLAAQAIATYRAARADAQLAVVPLLHLARIHRETELLPEAEEYMDQAARVLAEVRFVSIECNLLLERAALEHALGRDEQAMETYWQVLQMQRPLGDRGREAAAFTGLGRVLVRLGRAQEAADFHRQAVAIRSKHADGFLHAEALGHLADALEALGLASAHTARREAVILLARFEDPRATTLRAQLQARGADRHGRAD
jgi:tetratricopeptide (TPR) repeat protein